MVLLDKIPGVMLRKTIIFNTMFLCNLRVHGIKTKML